MSVSLNSLMQPNLELKNTNENKVPFGNISCSTEASYDKNTSSKNANSLSELIVYHRDNSDVSQTTWNYRLFESKNHVFRLNSASSTKKSSFPFVDETNGSFDDNFTPSIRKKITNYCLSITELDQKYTDDASSNSKLSLNKKIMFKSEQFSDEAHIKNKSKNVSFF